MRHWLVAGLCLLMLSGCAMNGIAEPGASSNTSDPVAQGCERTPGACVAEAVLIYAVDYLTLAAELCGAFVIAMGIARAIGSYLQHVFRRELSISHYTEDIRLRLGKSLALALEFELAADILKTAVAPTWAIIAQLAAIIVLRTALNYFLEREIRDVEKRRAPNSQSQPVAQ